MFSVNKNTVKEDNSKVNDTQLLEDEDLGVNKTNFVNIVDIPEEVKFEICEKTGDS